MLMKALKLIITQKNRLQSNINQDRSQDTDVGSIYIHFNTLHAQQATF